MAQTSYGRPPHPDAASPTSNVNRLKRAVGHSEANAVRSQYGVRPELLDRLHIYQGERGTI
jgi:hypothetical protein